MDNDQSKKIDNIGTPFASEESIYEFWEKSGFFKADPSSDKKPYSLLMPPPNLTGDPHMGHAMQHAILDAIARFKRMQGYDVLLLPGVDHAGLQFEGTLTKKLEKEGLSKQKLGREEWMKRAWQFRDEVYSSFHKTWSVFGVSADWSREVFTLEPKVQAAVVEEFKTYWDQGLLYKGAYIVNWCPKCGTAIEDVETEYEERTEKLYYINYVIEGSDELITVATARPETISADVAIAVYPHHPKYADLVGKLAINPFTNGQIAIIEDQRVEKDFGTGALKITPGHDPLDYQIGKDHGLPILHAIGKDGKVTELDPSLQGLKVEEARSRAVEILQEKGLLAKSEEYTHSVPLCERSKNPVEPLISEEWFVNMKPLAEKAIKNLDQVSFVPKNYHKIIGDWLEDIHDWCISRSQWWGHRVPAWYCLGCNPHKQVRKGSGFLISLDKPTGGCVMDPDQSEEVTKACQKCGDCQWVQDEQVLDTWFSSGLWPMATLGWPEKTPELDRYYPWDVELSAPEIKYLWISRMIALGLWFKDQVPFKNMFFHGTLRDLQGRKMSKSLGNGVDPIELIKQWGTDAVRMILYSYAAPGRDPKASRQTMDERAKNFRNFGTKLRNIERFIIDLKPEDAATKSEYSHPDDLEIMSQLKDLTKEVTSHIESFNLHLATEALYEFIWHKFADIYVEKSKTRRAEAQPCLEEVFTTSLLLLHPFMPFLTEELWQKMPARNAENNDAGGPHDGQSIMLATWP